MTPTARTLKKLAEDGWTAGEVERWIPHTRPPRRKDLYGFGDILAFNGDSVLIVQATNLKHVGERVAKIKAEPRAALWIAVENRELEVWGWRYLKKTRQWEPKITFFTDDSLTVAFQDGAPTSAILLQVPVFPPSPQEPPHD